MENNNETKRIETSKKIIWVSYAIAIALAIIICVEMRFGIDTSDTISAFMAVFAEITASNAFYFWKAKNENRHKYTIQLIERLQKEGYDGDFISRIAEIIIKD